MLVYKGFLLILIGNVENSSEYYSVVMDNIFKT